MTSYSLGFDLGTRACRAFLLNLADPSGAREGSGECEHVPEGGAGEAYAPVFSMVRERHAHLGLEDDLLQRPRAMRGES